MFTGIVTAQSGNSVTVVLAGGAARTLARADIAEMRSTGKSHEARACFKSSTPP